MGNFCNVSLVLINVSFIGDVRLEKNLCSENNKY